MGKAKHFANEDKRGAYRDTFVIAQNHQLDISTARNVRELGGYETPDGPTAYGRFLRAGSTQHLSYEDLSRLCSYGVTHVLDLRAEWESPQRTCAFHDLPGISWRNVALHELDLSGTRFQPSSGTHAYLVDQYLSMLANHEAVREIMTFCARAPREACVLFHCAAGMDRTGMVSMLLLALAGADRGEIARDYLYSFGSAKEVERAMTGVVCADSGSWMSLPELREGIEAVYDELLKSYDDVGEYLFECGVRTADIELLRARLLDA